MKIQSIAVKGESEPERKETRTKVGPANTFIYLIVYSRDPIGRPYSLWYKAFRHVETLFIQGNVFIRPGPLLVGVIRIKTLSWMNKVHVERPYSSYQAS